MRYLIQCWTLTLFVAIASEAAISFDPAVDYTVGQQPAGLDGDLALDLAVTGDVPEQVSLLFNAGDGSFGLPVQVVLGGGTGPHGVVAGDFDGDTDVDLAVSLKNVNAVQLLINNSGTFSPGAITGVAGLLPRDIVAGDLDLNGLPDVVTSNRDSDDVSVLLNPDRVLAAAVTYAAGQEPRGLALGHFNADNLLDLAVAASGSRQVSVLLNQGSGTFGAPIALSVGADLRPLGVTAADLDRDGLMDVATTTSDVGVDFASVFLRTGAGTFASRVDWAVGGVNPDGIVAADFDVDGLLDLATADQDSAQVSVLRNLGGGTFDTAIGLAVGTTPGPLSAPDLNQNSAADLVSVNQDSNNVSVLVNNNNGLIFDDDFESGDTSSWSSSVP